MQLIRANIAHFPTATKHPEQDISIILDGGLVIDNGTIVALAPFDEVNASFPQASIVDHSGKWLVPGFIDSHLHYPQTQSIASYGEQLLSWLENYTFPTEMQFADSAHSQTIAKVFLNQLLILRSNAPVVPAIFPSI